MIDNNSLSRSKSVFVSIFSIFLLVLLIFNLVRGIRTDFTSNSNLSFEGLLYFLENAPSITPSFAISDFTFTNDWGLLDPLRDVFNIFLTPVGFIIWLIFNLTQFLIYFLYFIRFMLIQ